MNIEQQAKELERIAEFMVKHYPKKSDVVFFPILGICFGLN